ncbi:MAG: DUF4870 domain-containing protein [Wenyingzhuangia sp.]|jgi:uncharacterized protein|uniref:DUF4870 domain-containing protein n=1 Tax=Wenyingzhuangia sp. TaxID=1964193 RepID=UPI003219D4ED
MDRSTEKVLAIILHLSGFLNGVFPIVVPLLIWLIKKDESSFINEHGKSALNFQLTVIILGVFAVLFTLFTFGLGAIFTFPLALIFGVLYIIFIVIATLNASRGQLYRYPVSLNIIK